MGGQLGEKLAQFAYTMDTGEHLCITDCGQSRQGREGAEWRQSWRPGARNGPGNRQPLGRKQAGRGCPGAARGAGLAGAQRSVCETASPTAPGPRAPGVAEQSPLGGRPRPRLPRGTNPCCQSLNAETAWLRGPEQSTEAASIHFRHSVSRAQSGCATSEPRGGR